MVTFHNDIVVDKDINCEVWSPTWLNSVAIMASRFQTLFFKLCKELKLKSKKDRVSTISYCVLYAKQYTNMSYACMIADHSQAADTGPPWPAWSLFCVYARLFWKLKLIQLFLSFYRWLEQHYKLFSLLTSCRPYVTCLYENCVAILSWDFQSRSDTWSHQKV